MNNYGGGRSDHSLSDHDFEMGFNIPGNGGYESCPSCFTGYLMSKDTHIVCNQCGYQQENIRANAILEYQDNFRAKQARMKIDDVKEKLNFQSPKKLGDHRKNLNGIGQLRDQGDELLSNKDGFRLIGHHEEPTKQQQEDDLNNTLNLKHNKKSMRSNVKAESYQDYIDAYSQMFKSIATKFSEVCLQNQEHREEFMINIKDLYQAYMKKWDSYQDSVPLSSLTQQRRGQLRMNTQNRYSGFKREFLQIKNTSNEIKTETLKEKQYENPDEQTQENQMIDQTEEDTFTDQMEKVRFGNLGKAQRNSNYNYSYDQLNKEYHKSLRTNRKRDNKQARKMSSGSTSADGQAAFYKTNFKKQIQDLITKDDTNIVLDFLALDSKCISLIERAKLFVKLKYSEKDFISEIRAIKFKQTVNNMISNNLLPKKSTLIQICKEELQIDYRKLKFKGLNSIKDRIILVIFMYNKVVSIQKKQNFLEQELIKQRQLEMRVDISDEQLEEGEIPMSQNIIVEDSHIDLQTNFDREKLKQFMIQEYHQEVLKFEVNKATIEELLEYLFEIVLNNECSQGLEEYQQFKQKVEFKEDTLKPPSHSLELNLMLAFIYMASRKYQILEKDILQAAQQNMIGYITEYKNHLHLRKADFLLRPINVPFKNKWLRDTVNDLTNKDNLPIQTIDHESLINKFCTELLISSEVKSQAIKLLNLISKQFKSQQLYIHFEVAALLIISLKLLYGLTDKHIEKHELEQYYQILLEDEQFSEFHEILIKQRNLPSFDEQYEAMQSSLEYSQNFNQDKENSQISLHRDKCCFWRIQDIKNMKDLDSQIQFAEENIFNIKKESTPKPLSNLVTNEIEDDEKLFKQRVSIISNKFTDYFSQYQQEQKGFEISENVSQEFGFKQNYEYEEGEIIEGEEEEKLQSQIRRKISMRKESEDFDKILDQMIPSRAYAAYNKKLKDLDCEYYHFEFMMIVKVFQDYLNEPTSHEILKQFRLIEKIMLMHIE
eukprot:403376406